jgi:hypothetical protein
MTTVLINGRAAALPAGAPGDGPWAPVGQLPQLTGWELKPEGACLGDLCVPLPAGDRFVRDGWFSLAALAEYLSQPLAHDPETQTWCIGEAAGDRASALDPAKAPDFRLTDHLGMEHQLTDYRGRKVFLVSWASW